MYEATTSRDFSSGLRASVPVVAGYLPAAVAFGVAARSAGLNTVEALAMSLLVYSGASQFAIAGLLSAGASWMATAAVALVLGVRHVLYGPSLAPRLSRAGEARTGAGRIAPAAFGLTDEVFAVASVEMPRGAGNLRWILGLELGAYASWLSGTWAGAALGAAVVEAVPSLAPALSFALPALFVALLVSLLRSQALATGGIPRPVAGAVLAAAAVAVASSLAGFGTWGVPAAGVVGSVAGVLLARRAGAG